MKKVVISGASGFIGKALVDRLLREGVEVTAIVSSNEKLEEIHNGLFKKVVANFSTFLQLPDLIEKEEWCELTPEENEIYAENTRNKNFMGKKDECLL